MQQLPKFKCFQLSHQNCQKLSHWSIVCPKIVSKCIFPHIFFIYLPFLVILPNLTYLSHYGSHYFNDYRRTKHQTNSTRKLGWSEKKFVGCNWIYVTLSTNNLEYEHHYEQGLHGDHIWPSGVERVNKIVLPPKYSVFEINSSLLEAWWNFSTLEVLIFPENIQITVSDAQIHDHQLY